MTIQEDRDEIEAALASVDGIHVYADPSAATRQGDAWIGMFRITRDAGGWPLATWRILIVTGQDTRTGETFLQTVLPAVAAALSGVLTWNEITPGRLQDSNTTVIQIDGNREISALEG